MPFALTVLTQEEAGLAVVAAEGAATAADFPSTGHYLFDQILGPRWDSLFILLDMDHVNYIDSSAVGWLLAVHKCFRSAGGKLVLHTLQPQVQQMLELLKIDRVIPLAHDIHSARAAHRTHLLTCPIVQRSY